MGFWQAQRGNLSFFYFFFSLEISKFAYAPGVRHTPREAPEERELRLREGEKREREKEARFVTQFY